MHKCYDLLDQTAEQWTAFTLEKYISRAWREASARANNVRHPILASVTVPISRIDPMRVFTTRQLASEYRIFWEPPSTGYAMLGIGEATSFKTGGLERFTRAIAFQQSIVKDAILHASLDARISLQDQDAIISPLLFGYFSFHHQNSTSRLWNFAPNSLLFLPRFLLAGKKELWNLTINTLISPKDNQEREIQSLLDSVTQLLASNSAYSSLQTQQPLLLKKLNEVSTQSMETWKRSIANATTMIQRGAHKKLVLANAITLAKEAHEEGWDIENVLRQLHIQHPESTIFAIQRGNHIFCGLTPERLAIVHHGYVHTTVTTAVTDAHTADNTSRQKDQQPLPERYEEHLEAGQITKDALEPLCTRIVTDTVPILFNRQNRPHLLSSLAGKLLPGRTILDVVAALHPTPAAGGIPPHRVYAATRRYERFERGWFTSPFGWLDGKGNGEFVTALQGMLLEKSQVTLFTDIPITADTNSSQACEELYAKLRTMLYSLTGEDEKSKED